MSNEHLGNRQFSPWAAGFFKGLKPLALFCRESSLGRSKDEMQQLPDWQQALDAL
jgi:hypothetical protein